MNDVKKSHGPEELTPIESAGPMPSRAGGCWGPRRVRPCSARGRPPRGRPRSSAGKRIKNGRIKQSIVHWCFAPYWDVPQMIKVAKQLGCGSIELLDAEVLPAAQGAGLECAIGTIDMGPDPPFVKGFNNPKYRDQVLKATRDAIDACAEFGYKNVICFTGMSEGIPDDVGADNCVEGFKQIVGHAEKKKVTLCLEMLNTRDASHPMKGHPGYQGDHTDYCIDIIKRVGSPNLKLLFDIYHVQIMDGDVIRRIRQHKDVHRPHPHRRQPRPRRARRQAGDRLQADHGSPRRDRLPGLRRPGVHPHPRPARRPRAGGDALRRLSDGYVTDGSRWQTSSAAAGDAIGVDRRAIARRIALGLGVLLARAARGVHRCLATAPSGPPRRRRSRATRSWSRGASSFSSRCVSCHGSSGRGDGPIAKGLAGPPVGDLTDATWKHGDKPEQVRGGHRPGRPQLGHAGLGRDLRPRGRPRGLGVRVLPRRAARCRRRCERPDDAGNASGHSAWTTASASISISAASSIRRATSTMVVAGRICPKTSPWASPTSCHLRDVGHVHAGPDHVRRLAAQRVDRREDDLQGAPASAP